MPGKPPPSPTPACAPSCGVAAGPRLELPGYRVEPFVEGFLPTAAGLVPAVRTRLSWADRLGALRARLGIGRMHYRVAPGLYAAGGPCADSPVLVTANYKLTFDALRRELAGVPAWILAVDTRGINVWCAAGKGSFSAAEVAARVAEARLDAVVAHRTLVLPQLAAPGVDAREVRRRCGFAAAWGPVRAADVQAYLRAGGRATAAMRRVTFPLAERLAVALVEFRNAAKPTLLLGLLALLLASGLGPDAYSASRAAARGGRLLAALGLGFLCGNFLFPALLPLLPSWGFLALGALLGALAGGLALLPAGSAGLADALALTLACSSVSAWFAVNYTGSTTYTSPSGVEQELRRHLPWLAGLAGLALALWLAGPFLHS